ncbi:MAG: L-threonylcarbamoyladenylate synthase [Capnocytophaga sp.]|nr:L-threonylcarbamoyladenylate synthase [Capnocytophaga sp.]
MTHIKTDFLYTFDDDILPSVTTLNNGGVLLYPTDTVWGLGCDATNQEAVNKIFNIKERHESKSLIILVASVEMLSKYVTVSNEILTYINAQTRPTTIIYPNPKEIAANAIAADNSIGIRIVNDAFCQSLLQAFGKPVISTSANISGEPTPRIFSEINPRIAKRSDYVVKYRQNDTSTREPSALVRYIGNNNFEKIR